MEKGNEIENSRFSNRDLIFLSVDPWQNDRWARKQMLAYLLAEKFRYVIYYVDPVRSERKTPIIKRLKTNLWLVDFPCVRLNFKTKFLVKMSKNLAFFAVRIIARILGVKEPIYVIYQPHNFDVARRLSNRLGSSIFCYDMTDDWSEFPGQEPSRKKQVKFEEQKVLKKVDLVFAVSQKLFEKAKNENPHAYYLPNGTSFRNFNQVTHNITTHPEVQSCPVPRIGYVGKVTPWRLDIALIRYLAINKPNWSIILIGPIHPAAKSFIEELKKNKNVYILGPKIFWDLPYYMKGFDACILPHKVDFLTESMDPIKLYDYLATGKPVVTTNIREAQKFKTVITISDTYEKFLSSLNEIVEHKENGSNAAERIKVAKENSWEFRIFEMMKIIESWEKRKMDLGHDLIAANDFKDIQKENL